MTWNHLQELVSTVDIVCNHGDRATIEHPAVDQMLRLWRRDPNLCYGRARVHTLAEGGASTAKAQVTNRITSYISLDRKAADYVAACQAELQQATLETEQESPSSH